MTEQRSLSQTASNNSLGLPWGTVKKLPAMQETQIQSLGQEDSLEKEMAAHSSILAWKKSHGQRSMVGYSPWGHKESDVTEQLTLSTFNKSLAKRT